ncbi:hypothetical protein ACOME3_002976 [Neoechinorhynchus agilis]
MSSHSTWKGETSFIKDIGSQDDGKMASRQIEAARSRGTFQSAQKAKPKKILRNGY